VAELCLEDGDIPWDEVGDCPEVYECELDGVRAGVPEFDCEWVAIIGAVTCDEGTWELMW